MLRLSPRVLDARGGIILITLRVFLKSGQSFDVRAEKGVCKYNSVTGELTSFKYENAVAGIPIYLDIGQVEAIVQVHEEGLLK